MLTLGLARAFTHKGHTVQCYKVGPDFIDPGFHSAVTERTSRNLDGWMLGEAYCTRCFKEHAQGADIAIVEGVMGLFDGYDGKTDAGSTAQIAKWLDLPVVLVVDAGSFARSAGALVLGYEQYDPDVTIAGVIFNRVAGASHYESLRDGVVARCGVEVLGYVPRNAGWQIPERHLGLVMAHEIEKLHASVSSLSQQLEETVNLDRLYALSGKRDVSGPGHVPPARSVSPGGKGPVIGVARDEAFCFYYEDNIDLLKQAGAQICFFSPVHDRSLPKSVHGLYLGGGYPELHAALLEKNLAMRRDIVSLCRSGAPVYAECGGFLYLLQGMIDHHNRRFEMAGFFPAEARMLPGLQRFGYVEVAAQNGCPFLLSGQRIRGHEFHYSDISRMPDSVERCYRVTRKRSKKVLREGYCTGSVLAGYIHLHFASNPAFVENFVDACRRRMKDTA